MITIVDSVGLGRVRQSSDCVPRSAMCGPQQIPNRPARARSTNMKSCPIVTLNRIKPRRIGLPVQGGVYGGGIENRRMYLARAHRFCSVIRRKLEATGEYRHCHPSFLVRDILINVERVFPDLGTFGVEYIPAGSNAQSPEITYLNTGDSYDLTVLYVNGHFTIGSWGDIVERGNYA